MDRQHLQTHAFFATLDRLRRHGNQAGIEEYVTGTLLELDRVGGEPTPEHAVVLNELASHYRAISRYAESAAAFRQALDILDHNGLGRSPQYATVLVNLAGTYRLDGRQPEAIELFLEAKDLLAQRGLQTDRAYHSVLNNLALAYQDRGRYEDAYAAAYESYQGIRRGAAADDKIAVALSNLAAIRLAMDRPAEAEDLIDEALARFERMPEDHVHLAAGLSIKGTLLYRAGRHREALGFFVRSQDLTERFFGHNEDYAAAAWNRSKAHEALGDVEEALDQVRAAQAVFERIFGAEHPRAVACRRTAEKLADRGFGR